MDNIKDILGKVVGDISSKKLTSQKMVERAWLEAASEKAQHHTRLMNFQDGTLFVNVDTPAWLYEMNTKRNKMLDHTKQKFPELKNIRFQVGKV